MDNTLTKERPTDRIPHTNQLAEPSAQRTTPRTTPSRPAPTLAQLESALRASWGADTTADPAEWTSARRSRGQCDVTSLVLRHYLGGDLVLARVFIDCVQTEHHWWNRFPTGDIDLTRDQFYPHQDVIEHKVFDAAAIAEAGPIRPELLERFDRLLRRVTDHLAAN